MIVNKINFVIVVNHPMVIWFFVKIYIVKENGFISIVLKKLRKLLEAQPSVASSYPGEVASGSISPALLGQKK